MTKSSTLRVSCPRCGYDLTGVQKGYGAFTVSKSLEPKVIEYIRNQAEHHWKHRFQEEFVALLEKHGIDYEERYLWV